MDISSKMWGGIENKRSLLRSIKSWEKGDPLGL